MRRAGRWLLLAVLAACGGGPDGPTVDISGSSTVEPISIAVAELFLDVDDDVIVNIDGPGTGDGFELFCSGETDISDASRPIKDEEAAKCERAGIEFVELKIAFDGLTVLTNPDNDLECLHVNDLYALVGPESQGIDAWDEAEELAAALGSDTTFPALDLTIVGPGEESGTYDSFVELALADPAEVRLGTGDITEDVAETTRPDYQASGDDNVIIQGVEGASGALGWVGYAFAQEAGDKVKQLEIDGGDGCVAPTAEAIAAGEYPLSRPLFIYVSTDAAERNAGVEAFVDFYLGKGIVSVTDVGYVALPPDQLAETIAAWERR